MEAGIKAISVGPHFATRDEIGFYRDAKYMIQSRRLEVTFFLRFATRRKLYHFYSSSVLAFQSLPERKQDTFSRRVGRSIPPEMKAFTPLREK